MSTLQRYVIPFWDVTREKRKNQTITTATITKRKPGHRRALEDQSRTKRVRSFSRRPGRERCCGCGRLASKSHEKRRRTIGGVFSLENGNHNLVGYYTRVHDDHFVLNTHYR
uniref:Uncharacterized protein n=1 Tax=Sipha flava TaxID=143950 RepID=A0A2S2QX11_9HEMI